MIEAVQWDGTEKCLEDVMIPFIMDGHEDFSHLPNDGHINPGIGYVPPSGQLMIPTLEGTMAANPRDWIIKGVNGEFYPCKPDIFEKTYESADTDLADPAPELLEALKYFYDYGYDRARCEAAISKAEGGAE